jgi:hypothetical protein
VGVKGLKKGFEKIFKVSLGGNIIGVPVFQLFSFKEGFCIFFGPIIQKSGIFNKRENGLFRN